MIPKLKEKQKAIILRKKGLSYNEILHRVPVAKSTLSLWLRNIGLAKHQKQKFTERRQLAQLKAQQAWRNKRILSTEIIKSAAKKEVGKISKREFWLIGAILYWAEGSKQRETSISSRVVFSNSDPNMIKVYLKWLKEICNIRPSDIDYRLYIHENANEEKAKNFWSKLICISEIKFKKTVYKKHKVKTNRKINYDYNGLLSITVKRSTNFNRKITGWIDGICNNI